VAESSKQTPLMQQFWEIKNQHLDKVLLFRMGDFYEMFFDDAKTAAPILNIALTSRNKKSEDETPMCGVPHHSIAGPIGKLLAAGLRVAICDQLEDPETAKGIVKRGVTRILSPGMVYDPESLAATTANYVAAFDDRTLAYIDASSGEAFYYTFSKPDELFAILALLRPTEIVITRRQIEEFRGPLNELQILNTVYEDLELQWPERFSSVPESAHRLLTYAVGMQGPEVLASLRSFERRSLTTRMALSPNVLKHLEIFTSYVGNERGSLFGAINRTRTSSGARLLKNWLRFPLANRGEIDERLDRVTEWVTKSADLKILRQTLGSMGDIERRLAKISYANCQVRDLVALKDSLDVGLVLKTFCPGMTSEELETVKFVVDAIAAQIVDEPPLNTKNGGYIRRGVNSVLDELITISEDGQSLLLAFEAREREATGISSLKVRYNNVFGYYIEITNTHKEKAPDHYKRKQTLTNAERYVTQELAELEEKILSSRDRRVKLEEQVFSELRTAILRRAPVLLRAADRWSELDVLTSAAWLALEQKYARPQFSQSKDILIESSRHPVVEQEVAKTFVPNTISLKQGECLLLTGPNMAGKSTLMRQVATTVLLAQIGFYIPAKAASLPLFKQIFTRIGASDLLSAGLSTFMVEMQETAEMLRGADEDTLVVLDEVGRGTSTYDGMSLAQAILEFLLNRARSYTLFATHYHEMTNLADTFTQVRNAHMSVAEKGHDIHFLYTLKNGPANRSYGIQVARLAGLPDVVVQRAQDLLKGHESRRSVLADEVDLPLFSQNWSTNSDGQSNVSK
jgi:DNA mismatch repair protein MutS